MEWGCISAHKMDAFAFFLTDTDAETQRGILEALNMFSIYIMRTHLKLFGCLFCHRNKPEQEKDNVTHEVSNMRMLAI